MFICKLPKDILKLLVEYLESELDNHNFACTNHQLWKEIIFLKFYHFVPLNTRRITGLKLHRITKIVIMNDNYDNNLLYHVFRYSNNLQTVQVESRNMYAVLFFINFIKICTSETSWILQIPAAAEDAWNVATKTTSIPVKMKVTFHSDISDDETVDPQSIITPESVKEKCLQYKNALKLEYARQNTYQLKNEVSTLISTPHITKLCDTASYCVLQNDISSFTCMNKNHKLIYKNVND